ncbi:MAG TPA: vanadium-dependent haloperoxidase [Actinomycetota bacterium]|nr:vanadium-dependent haloperoxidase [Actinomycetota bacterium]
MSQDRHTAASGQEPPLAQAGEATGPSAGARSPGRRGFLLGVGGLAAAALVDPGGRWLGSEPTTSGSARSRQPSGSGFGLDVEARRTRALQLRLTTARRQLRDPFPQARPNGDEDRYDIVGLANFTKALPHNPLGEVDPGAYRALLRALRSGRSQDFRRIPLGGSVKLANPEGAFSFELQGPDPWQRPVKAPPTLNSEAFAGEMTECYWLALARDIPYSRFGQEPITAAAIQDLRAFADYQGLDARTLFRATDPQLPGVATGPYISQFLLQPYTFGSTPTEQRYRTTVAGSDHLTSYPAWLAVQNGQPTTTSAQFDPTPRFIRNGRDLGEWSHRDFSYQGPLVACLILLGYLARYGPQVLNEANPFRDHPTQTGGVTFGAPDMLDQVARSANAAMKAAWYSKWLVHRRLRPEETGGLVHNHMTGAAEYPLPPKLTGSAVLDRLYSRNGTYLCPQAYPEGCPTHPAYPGATATIGGAGVRVLKAFFNPEFVIPEPVVPTDDGLSLRAWRGEPLTVGGELNKLAFNMAFGRDTAGVHFRRDEIEGILLGEGAYSAPAGNDSAPAGNASIEGYERGGYEYSH